MNEKEKIIDILVKIAAEISDNIKAIIGYILDGDYLVAGWRLGILIQHTDYCKSRMILARKLLNQLYEKQQKTEEKNEETLSEQLIKRIAFK